LFLFLFLSLFILDSEFMGLMYSRKHPVQS
jgi:hypothetical protein